jgi:hypothetical protein
LKAYGISSRRRFKKMEDKARTIIELTDIDPINVNGRIILLARQRFGLRVFVDPLMYRLDEGVGSTDAPEHPVIYLDLLQVQNGFTRPNSVLLHEIRHIFLSHKTAQGLAHRYQGELIAEGDFRFERAGFYDEEVSFEELSNYAHDARIHLRRYENGQLARTHILRDLNYLRRIARLIAKHLRMVRLDARGLFTARAETFKGVVLVWPVFQDDAREAKTIFYLHLDFPGVAARASVRSLRPAAWQMITRMIQEADAESEFAQNQLARLQSKKDI